MRPCGRLAVLGTPETLRCPSKQGHKQLKSSSYPRGEWHGHFASWRKERSGAKEVVERTEEKGQWQEGGGSEEGVKQDAMGHSCQAWWDGTGASCPWPWSLLHLGDKSGTLLEPQGMVGDLPTQITFAWIGAICLTPPGSVGWSCHTNYHCKGSQPSASGKWHLS